jgi:replicative DNA helicase
MLNILSNCIHQGLRVLLINREMTNVEMLKKLIALESGKISYGVIRRGVYDTITLAEVESTRKRIEELYSSDKFMMFDNLRDFTSASSQVKKFKPDVVFDDYIQLIKPNEKIDQRRLQLEEIVHGYKWVAKTNNCVVVLLSQLNRMLETRAGYPKLSDLAESGSIEQVAENVFFVYYDYKIKLENSKLGKNVIELVASKVRYGNSGVARLGYNGDKVKIYNSIEDMENAK